MNTIGPRSRYGTVSAFVHTPAGPRVAEYDTETVVCAWDAATGAPRGTPPLFPYQFGSVAWSPDRTRVASAGSDDTVRIWSVASGDLVQTADGPAEALAWSPDGRYLAGGGTRRDWLIWLWDARTGHRVAVLDDHSYGPAALAWSPDGNLLAAAGERYRGGTGPTVHVWELPAGVLRCGFAGHGAAATALAWSPDSRLVASGGGYPDRTVRVWEPRTGRLRHTYRGHTGRIQALAWSPRGDRIASSAGDEDGTVQVWPVRDARPSTVYSAHPQAAVELQWSPDGGRIASAAGDGQIHIWAAGTGMRQAVAADQRGHRVRGLSWSSDGHEIAACSWRGVLRCWEPHSRQHVRSLHSHGDGVDDLAWSPDGRLLAAGGRSPVVEVWDIAAGAVIASREADSDQELLAWSRNSARLAGREPDGRLFVLDVQTGDCVISETDQRLAMTVVWAPDGSRLATAGQDDTARVFDAASLRLVTTYRGRPGATWVRLGQWSPDSRHLLSMSDIDKGSHVWDAATGDPVAAYDGHRFRPSRAHWSPDGTLVASVDWQAVHVWEPFTGRQVLIAVRDTIRRTWSLSQPSTEPEPGRVRVAADEPDPAMVELGVGYPADRPLWSPDGVLLLANADTAVRLR